MIAGLVYWVASPGETGWHHRWTVLDNTIVLSRGHRLEAQSVTANDGRKEKQECWRVSEWVGVGRRDNGKLGAIMKA